MIHGATSAIFFNVFPEVQRFQLFRNVTRLQSSPFFIPNQRTTRGRRLVRDARPRFPPFSPVPRGRVSRTVSARRSLVPARRSLVGREKRDCFAVYNVTDVSRLWLPLQGMIIIKRKTQCILFIEIRSDGVFVMISP